MSLKGMSAVTVHPGNVDFEGHLLQGQLINHGQEVQIPGTFRSSQKCCNFFFFLRFFFFNMGHFFKKVFTEFVGTLLLLYGSVFLASGDVGS